MFQKITTHPVEEVAAALHVSVATVYTRLNRDPNSLPPVLDIKGSSKLVFCNLDQWLAQKMSRPMQALGLQNQQEGRPQEEKKKRGRPTHASRIKNGAHHENH